MIIYKVYSLYFDSLDIRYYHELDHIVMVIDLVQYFIGLRYT
jgi:hypothetical protein